MNNQKTQPPVFTGMPARAFRLLASLEARNERAWMEEHAEDVQTHLREPFLRFLTAATSRLKAAGIELQGNAETIFRMQRDLRFTPDRRPFHEHLEAVFSSDGRRIGTRGSIHVRFGGDGGFLRAGLFLATPKARLALREAMVARSSRFLDVAERLESARLELGSDRALKGMPRGFQGVQDPALGRYLRLVDPYAELRLPRVAWRSDRILEETTAFAEATRSWRLFMVEALKEVPEDLAAARPPRPPKTPMGAAAGGGKARRRV